MADDVKALARRFYDEVINGKNLDAIDELCTADFVEHEEVPGLEGTGLDAVKAFFRHFHEAFPDLRADVHALIAEGDQVAVRVTFSGTHQGDFGGIPPTGRRVAVDAIDWLRFEGGRAAEHWGASDQLSLMRQLGAGGPPG